MGYILKVVLENHVADPTGTLCEIVERTKDLLDEILTELDLIVRTNGRKGIKAILIMREEDYIKPIKIIGSRSHCEECGQPNRGE